MDNRQLPCCQPQEGLFQESHEANLIVPVWEDFQAALYLNNRYELDGRDSIGYPGVAWCLGQHDRVRGERSVFGKVRYMNAAGMEREFDMEAYVERVKASHAGPS